MSNSALDGEIRDGRHVMPVRVYYEDTDFSGAVYHASYLRFMERGRTNYLRLLGVGHRVLFEEAQKEARGFAFVVRSMQIEFLKPARSRHGCSFAACSALALSQAAWKRSAMTWNDKSTAVLRATRNKSAPALPKSSANQAPMMMVTCITTMRM